MRILAIAMVAAMATTSALAEETVAVEATPMITGAVNLDFAETAAGKTAGTMGIELDIDAGSLATIDLDLKATDGSSLTLDTWAVGTSVAGVGLTFGDDNGLLPSTAANTVADGTLADPAMTESLVATVGSLSVAVGLTDWTADITDVSNLQGAYTLDAGFANVTASLDYNRASENTVFGGAVDGIDLGMLTAGGMATYDTDAEAVAYEGTVTLSSLTAYLNGSDTNKLQHIGGEYTLDYNGAELTAGVDYDTDAEDFTPQAGLSFSF
tara:strand:+ start:192 stop:995 length:804 start_codon:yes stop_codon:yes gene_type:complete